MVFAKLRDGMAGFVATAKLIGERCGKTSNGHPR